MNTRSLIAVGLVCATVVAVAAFLSNAGPLSPPAGPIAPTNKTLAEVEPRVAVNAANTPGDNDATPSLFKISQPGSYYLTGNITGVSGKHGIEIASRGVTLNLNGFELLGVADSLDGVLVTIIAQNVHIRNGSVRNWDGDGVDAINTSNSSLRDLLAVSNDGDGLRLGGGGIVEACSAQSNGGDGVRADFNSTVSGVAALFNGGAGVSTGDGSTVSGATAAFNDGDGIVAGNGSTVSGTTAQDNSGRGIDTGSGSTAINNTARSNGREGIVALSGSTVSGNTALFNTGDGISAGGASTVSGNAAQSNGGDGIFAASGSIVSRNTAAFNNANGIRTGVASTVSGNTAKSNAANGVLAADGSTIRGNTASSNRGDGIRVAGGVSGSALVINNTCDSNGNGGDGAGVHVINRDNRIEGNSVTNNDRGVDVDGCFNLIIRNTTSGNTTSFDILVDCNSVGEILTAGLTITSGNPWANFRY